MDLQELGEELGMQWQEALADRFMESEELYIRFLRKLLNAQDYAQLMQEIEVQNWGEALRRAHNLKGVCANLGLTVLSGYFAKLVTLLRKESFTAAEVQPLVQQLAPEWERTLIAIAALEA